MGADTPHFYRLLLTLLDVRPNLLQLLGGIHHLVFRRIGGQWVDPCFYLHFSRDHLFGHLNVKRS